MPTKIGGIYAIHKSKILSLAFLAVVVFTMLVMQVSASSTQQVGDFTVTGNPSAYAFENGRLTVYGDDPLTISGTTTSHNIWIKAANANITLDNISIDVSALVETAGIDVRDSSIVNITLVGHNTLKGGVRRAGLQAITGASIIINGPGSLDSYGGPNGAGIGARHRTTAGNITINGGIIRAISPGNASAIGGGFDGGTIYALGTPEYYSAIGGYIEQLQGTFSTAENSNIYICAANPIGDQSNKSNWSGVIIESNSGFVYGDNITLTTDAVLESGKTLTIEEGKTLTVEQGKRLTVNGTIINYGNLVGILLPEDVNQDYTVDEADLQEIVSTQNYNKLISENGVNQKTDVNSDGIINFLDLAITRNTKHFNK